MGFGIIFGRAAEIISAIAGNPLVYLPLIGSWLITVTYFIINKDEKHGHTYVMSTGIAHIFTAYIVSPFAKSEAGWSLSDLRTIIAIILFAYGLFLAVVGILRAFPDILAEFFGDPGHALAPGLMAILYIEDNIPFDWTTFLVIITPILILGAIKIYRRFKG